MLKTTNSTDCSSSTAASLIANGGAYIGKKLSVGGYAVLQSTSNSILLTKSYFPDKRGPLGCSINGTQVNFSGRTGKYSFTLDIKFKAGVVSGTSITFTIGNLKSTTVRIGTNLSAMSPYSVTFSNVSFDGSQIGKNYTVSASYSGSVFPISSVSNFKLNDYGENSGKMIAIGDVTDIYAGNTVIGCTNGGQSRRIEIGANGSSYVYATSNTSGLTATSSDRRDKADFESITSSLEFVNELKPVTFVDNHRDKYIIEGIFDEENYTAQTFKGHRRIAGFIAQEVYQSMKDIYNDDNYASIVDYSRYDEDSEVDRYYMRYTQLIPFLTGAIQELSSKLDTATNKISELESKIAELQDK